ncbi:FAD/FMN-containing dehydrogenase [Sinobacterium caligoides]|uniref:FAD/FMN-containing dehydrogenase n=1 Tax=Sinobacterium caligoides TaxID=933926 RepID=A0A3N2DQ20_9GAMM|nr:FAD-binding protein [Sinobacterium caligoides]ROS01918.1 FAD/FMN-containing dehydrogenase [Sinobacterium caligoides]
MMGINKGVLKAAIAFITATLCAATFAGGGGPPKPTVSAERVHITFTADTNPAKLMPIRILEGIEIWPAEDESNVTHYNVYWGDSERNKLGIALAPKLAHIPVRGDGEVISYDFKSALKMEAGAIWVLVCTENNGKEFCGKEKNMEKVTDDLIGTFLTLNSIKKLIKDNNEQSCSGLEVMATCGDLECNGIETEQSCPSDCSSYGLSSFNYQTLCDEVKNVYHPESVADVQDIIKNAAANGQHVKVNGGAGYKGTTGSASDIVCTDGVVISMDKFDHHAAGLEMALETYEEQEVVNIPAGTNLHEVGEWLYERGRGIGFTHLGWRHPSIAGAIGTSAHGSSPRHNGIVSHRVVAMDIVNPEGELETFSAGTTGVTDPDLWKAMTTHLGFFGVITGVRVAVEDAKNLQVKVTFHNQRELFSENKAGSIFDDIKDCDYGTYNWFPTLNKYMKTCGKLTTKEAEDGAENRLLFPYIDLSQLSAQQTMQIYQLGACQPESGAHQMMSKMRMNGWHLTPPLVKTIGGKTRYTSDAIGPVHRMISAKLIDTVPREVFQMDWEVSVPAENLQAAMEYLKDATNGDNISGREIPVSLIGMFIRFSKSEDKTLMAYTGTGGPFKDGTITAHIETPIFVPVNLTPEEFDNYMGPYEEIMENLVVKYGARGHWGKNMHSMDPWLFELQQEVGSYDYDSRFQRFSEQVGRFDPKGMFANRAAKTLGIEYPEYNYPADW